MMKHRLKFACLALVAAGASWFAPAAKADEWDKKTVLTFKRAGRSSGKGSGCGDLRIQIVGQRVRSKHRRDLYGR